jgi:hypothetical protein
MKMKAEIKHEGTHTFFVIQLDSLGSVPSVFLEGKEITHKIKVEFSWKR